MGTEGAYPPYNFINDNGKPDGFEIELGDKLCAMEKLTCTWVTNDWDSIIPNLLSGNYDTIMAGMSITDERERSIDFTQPYYPPAASAYARPRRDVDVKTGVIAAQTGTIQAAYVAESGADAAGVRHRRRHHRGGQERRGRRGLRRQGLPQALSSTTRATR